MNALALIEKDCTEEVDFVVVYLKTSELIQRYKVDHERGRFIDFEV